MGNSGEEDREREREKDTAQKSPAGKKNAKGKENSSTNVHLSMANVSFYMLFVQSTCLCKIDDIM